MTVQKDCCVVILVHNVCKIQYDPSGTESEHGTKLGELKQECTHKMYFHLLLMEDLNYPNINWNNWTSKNNATDNEENKFIKVLQDNALEQHIMESTRC